MADKQGSLVLAKRKSADQEGEVKENDNSSLLALSLGSIYGNPVGSRTSPAVPLHAVDGSGAPSAAAPAANPPPKSSVSSVLFSPTVALGLAATVVHGNGDGGALLAAGVLTANQVPVSISPARGSGTIASAPPPFKGGVVPSAPPSPPPSKEASNKPPTKRPRVTKRSSPSIAAADEAPTNGGLTKSPPFPWATNRVAMHYSLAELSERGVTVVEGEVQCKRCDVRKMIAFNINAKFKEVYSFVVRNVQSMDDRAPPEWMDPVLPDCDKCGQKNSLRPVIAAEKEKINWMFLLLGQTLGLCTLDHLKHFCAHTKQHRTGAKDRVLYSTYMELCNQLCPHGPFDMASERRNRSLPFA